MHQLTETKFRIKIPVKTSKRIRSLFESPDNKYISIGSSTKCSYVHSVFYMNDMEYMPAIWKVHRDFTHMYMYWSPYDFYSAQHDTYRLISGKDIYLIRVKFAALFHCILMLKIKLTRIRKRRIIRRMITIYMTRSPLSIFSKMIHYPIQKSILEYI